MVQRVLRWERQERWYDRKMQGPMAKKWYFNIFEWIFFDASYTTLLTSKTHFPTSIWSYKSWEASPHSMCLDHIIANDIYHFFHALPLELAPTCYIKQCGTSRTQEFECNFFSYLLTKMFGVWGLLIYHWKGLKTPFQWYIAHQKL